YWNGSTWVNNTVRQQQGYASVQWTNPSYDWNVSIDASAVGNLRWGSTGATNPTIRSVINNDIVFGSNGTVPQSTGSPSFGYSENATWWAISLKPQDRGKLLYMETIPMVNTQYNDLLSYQRASEGVFVFVEMPTLKWSGHSMYTGKKLWETRALSEFNPFGYFSFPSLMYDEASTIAYGKLYVGGYIGGVFAFDLYNGTELWNYTAPTDMSVFKYYTLMLGGVADNKLFVGTHEHSADTPLFKGNRLRVLDVNTGESLYEMISWPHPRTMAFADDTLIYWNNYDHQIYALSKGPSSTTVQAPSAAITLGSSLVITGSVMDVSAGTKQPEQAARFPNGVPAMSEDSQAVWMEYVYMQKARPTSATGVEVTLSVMDSNGNTREIGKATSDSSGVFSYQWTPDITGKYTVYATFAGSNSYYPSFNEAAFAVDPAPPAQPEEPQAPPSMTDTYVLAGVAAIIVAIAIVGAVVVLLLRKRP
ncbi:MAG TPA: hypothetical protein VJL33_04885, partial [Candidatus Bathyarchaeia archaeon]|nr:hypothetical protein [Candidatus Bathyarchaeia archaeon]